MTHYLAEDFFKYIDGTYDKGSEAVLKAHLKNCPECSNLYQELSGLDKALHQLPAEHPSPHFTTGIISRLYPATREQASISFTFLGQYLMIFGIVVALLILLISMFSLGFLDATLIDSNPVVSRWVGSPAFLKIVSNALLGVCILVMLVVLDKAVLLPYFKKRREEKITLSH